MKINIPFLVFIVTLLFITSCSDKKGDTSKSSEIQESTSEVPNSLSSWESQYDKIEATEIPENPIELIGKNWMAITAGNKDAYNAMTASWGTLGEMWDRPSAHIFVKDTRYTYQFLEAEDSFTLSFFSEDYRGALKTLGTRSGRDTDKVKDAGLTPIETPSGLVTFKEARMIIECKKMYSHALGYEDFEPEYKDIFMSDYYSDGVSNHHIFIGEIINVWIKK